MNYWKYIVMSLLGLIMLFHIGAVWHIRGNHYELTSPDYYARELDHESMLAKLRAGSGWQWQVNLKSGTRELLISVTNAEGIAVPLSHAQATLYRPNHADLDQAVELVGQQDNRMIARLDRLDQGRWDLTVEGVIGQTQVAYHERLSVP